MQFHRREDELADIRAQNVRAMLKDLAVGPTRTHYKTGEQMPTDKRSAEQVRLAGWTAGATEKDKNSNPHRGKKTDDEALWDEAWEKGFAGEDYEVWS